MRGAERLDDLAGAPEIDARDRREQVVLDLVVQAAEQEIGQRAGRDVARAKYLPLQEGER